MLSFHLKGSGEKMGYDYINHFAYTAGERGNIKVVDYENPLIPQLTEYSFDLTGENNDLKGIMVRVLPHKESYVGTSPCLLTRVNISSGLQ